MSWKTLLCSGREIELCFAPVGHRKNQMRNQSKETVTVVFQGCCVFRVKRCEVWTSTLKGSAFPSIANCPKFQRNSWNNNVFFRHFLIGYFP